MGTIEKELKEVIEKKEKNDAKGIKGLSKISDDFNKMVNSGLTTRKSYNLMTISDIQKVMYEVNC